MDSLFSNNNTDTVRSSRIIYTPSAFARSSLLHLQETGTLQALKSIRANGRDFIPVCFLPSFPALEGWSMGAEFMSFGRETVYSLTAGSLTAMKRAETARRPEKRKPAGERSKTRKTPSGPCSGVIFTARI